jgi:hypothetical protein
MLPMKEQRIMIRLEELLGEEQT